MKLEIDTNDGRQVQAGYELFRSLLGISGAPKPADAPASPPKAAAPSTSTPAAAKPAVNELSASSVVTAPAAQAAALTDGASVDLPTLTAAFQAFVKANGPAKMKAILTEHGAANIPAIPEDQRAAVLAKLQPAA